VARLLLNTLVLAALCAGVLAVRIYAQGEPFNPRTQTIITLAALAGGVAGALLSPFFGTRRDWIARGRAGAAFMVVFMLAMMVFYVIEYEFIARSFEPPPMLRPLGILLGMSQTAGYFLAFSPSYLLPWELPLLAGLAGLLLPGISERKG
jgi:hypothetical protein